MIMTQYIGV